MYNIIPITKHRTRHITYTNIILTINNTNNKHQYDKQQTPHIRKSDGAERIKVVEGARVQQKQN